MLKLPTVIRQNILKLVDKNGLEVTNFDWIDPESPKLLIQPTIGKTYVCTVYILNTSEWQVLHVRLTHDYEDLRIEPSYVGSLKSKKSVKIRLIWRPFTEKGITEKIKNHKVSISFQPHCTVETISEIPEEVKK